MSGRRIAGVLLSPELIVDMMKPLHSPRFVRVVDNALPDDARYVGVRHDPYIDGLIAVVESETFAEVEQGTQFPMLPPAAFRVIESRQLGRRGARAGDAC